MRIGYARVSKYDQNLELQMDALKIAGCEQIFAGKASGGKMERQGLSDAYSHLREEDIFIVWKLDRLGRNVKGVVEFICDLEEKGVHYRKPSPLINRSGN